MRSCRQLENKVFFKACGISFVYRFSDVKIYNQFFINSKKKTDFHLMKLIISDLVKTKPQKTPTGCENLEIVKTNYKAYTKAKIPLIYDWL
jgi:hypothetical protein